MGAKELALGVARLALDQVEGHIPAENDTPLVGEAARKGAGHRADPGYRRDAEGDAGEKNAESTQPAPEIPESEPQNEGQAQPCRSSRPCHGAQLMSKTGMLSRDHVLPAWRLAWMPAMRVLLLVLLLLLLALLGLHLLLALLLSLHLHLALLLHLLGTLGLHLLLALLLHLHLALLLHLLGTLGLHLLLALLLHLHLPLLLGLLGTLRLHLLLALLLHLHLPLLLGLVGALRLHLLLALLLHLHLPLLLGLLGAFRLNLLLALLLHQHLPLTLLRPLRLNLLRLLLPLHLSLPGRHRLGTRRFGLRRPTGVAWMNRQVDGWRYSVPDRRDLVPAICPGRRMARQRIRLPLSR
jgi:hypothetical protein